MSRFPSVSTAGRDVPASIFARLREHLATFPGDFIPLQIGDTHLAPAHALDAIEWTAMPAAEIYTYGTPAGWDPLVTAIVAKARSKNGLDVTAANVQVTVGTTHALHCAVQAVCDPGDELILVTPHWPLIKGIAIGHAVTPVEVVGVANLECAVTPKTSAIYVASPNNPDGAMLDGAQVAELVRIARAHDLWILSDEVYEDYVYDLPHISIASRAPERTITTFSFAKSYAQAGLRVGYALGPEPVIAAMRKLVNHSVYNVPVAMQVAAYRAMQEPLFLAAARDRYRAARDRARARLTAPAATPPGGAYLWVDFSQWSGDDCMPVLEKIAAQGVLLAPGSAFGDACTAHARLCFTGVDEVRLDEGIDRINRVLAAW
ncbi:MAG TPA: pyridoxal phosphate-dependent aminotransferase [Kofleriaceae bacterium]